MDPQQSLVLSVGYGALIKGSGSSYSINSRSTFTNSNVGVFVGVEPSGLEKKEASVFSASGGAYLTQDVSDVTVSNLRFSDDSRAHIFVSWLHPYKRDSRLEEH